MIITIAKPFEEIIKNLKQYKTVFVVGCAACATKCQTGSEEAVKKIILEIEKENKKVTGYIILDTPCDLRIVKRDLSKNNELDAADAVLVLACGAGIQTIEKVTAKPIYPALNPVFVGSTERIGIYDEYCVVCGECILDKTGGICPLSRCAKGLLNGPCGGFMDGKCEVDPQRDCAWVLIFDKLKKLGRERDIVNLYMSPRKSLKPVRITKQQGNK